LPRRIQISLVLCLCFLGTGAQWDLMQVFAWGRMTVEHAQSMPLTQAVAKTFDGEMCGICRMVANAKKQEQSRSNVPELKMESKILLFFQAAPKVVVEAPRSAAWRPTEATVVTAGRSAPPVPPPRAERA
jgi:hypothetical protein